MRNSVWVRVLRVYLNRNETEILALHGMNSVERIEQPRGEPTARCDFVRPIANHRMLTKINTAFHSGFFVCNHTAARYNADHSSIDLHKSRNASRSVVVAVACSDSDGGVHARGGLTGISLRASDASGFPDVLKSRRRSMPLLDSLLEVRSCD